MTKDLREEARELAQGILRNLELQEIPLSSILLRCRRLARLIEDEAAYTWFGYELNGYPCSDGVVEDNAFQIALAHGRETGRNENGPLVTVSTIAELEARASTQELQLHQECEPDIHHVPANQYDTLPWRTGSLIRGQLAKEITAARTLIAKVQATVHTWVESTSYELEFAGTVTDVWNERRQLIDARLAAICPEAFRRLDALYRRIPEEDPEAWSQAAQTVRNVMRAVADSLFPATEENRAEGPGGELIEVNEEKYKNRLMAFVREREKSSRKESLIKGKIEAIYRSIRDIHNAASDAAKREIDKRYVEDLLLNLYLLLGDLVLLAPEGRIRSTS